MLQRPSHLSPIYSGDVSPAEVSIKLIIKTLHDYLTEISTFLQDHGIPICISLPNCLMDNQGIIERLTFIKLYLFYGSNVEQHFQMSTIC